MVLSTETGYIRVIDLLTLKPLLYVKDGDSTGIIEIILSKTEDELIVKLIQSRKCFKNRNLVSMEDYWFSGDQSLCSNIRKLEMVF